MNQKQTTLFCCNFIRDKCRLLPEGYIIVIIFIPLHTTVDNINILGIFMHYMLNVILGASFKISYKYLVVVSKLNFASLNH